MADLSTTRKLGHGRRARRLTLIPNATAQLRVAALAAVMTAVLVASVLIAAPAGLKVLPRLSSHDALSVVYLGVVQIGLAYTLFTVAMARGVRSLDAGIIGYVEPVLNPIWVYLVLGERPTQWALVGGAIIVIAVVCHTLIEARRGRRLVELA